MIMKHIVQIDKTYSLVVESVEGKVLLSVRAMSITVFQRWITPDQAQAVAVALTYSTTPERSR